MTVQSSTPDTTNLHPQYRSSTVSAPPTPTNDQELMEIKPSIVGDDSVLQDPQLAEAAVTKEQTRVGF